MTGERLSHFQLEQEIYKDYAGSVRRATDVSDGRAVTLRLIPTSVFLTENDKQQFIRDMLTISAMSHRNVAAVYGVEEADDHVLVSCEAYGVPIDGGEEPVGDLEELLAGLGAAYENGVLHGGLCPRVISRTESGGLKVYWFGMGRFMHGTPALAHSIYDLAYMSPEAIQGREIDERSDLWSVGVILYEWLTGSLPFRGQDPATLAHDVFNARPPVPAGVRSGDELSLAQLSNELLNKNPSDRPGSVADVVERLKSETGGVVAGVGPEGPTDDSPRDGFLNAEETVTRVSLMVLYLACAGSDPDKSYLATGLTENLISRLSGFDELILASKHDSLTCRGRDVDPRELGRCMGVDSVLRGSVRTSGDEIRVDAQIIDVNTGVETWNSRFDGTLDNIIELQMTLASEVVDALCFHVSDAEREVFSKHPTTDPVAYDFYMRGREFMSTGGVQNAEAAIRMYEFAAASDPSFALSLANLAEAYTDMYAYYDGSDFWLDRVSEAAQRALDLDPGLALARFSLGVVCFYRKQYTEAREAFERITQEKPRCYEAYRWLGIVADVTGDFDTALARYKESAEIKPCSVEPWLYINMTHRRRGDVTAANDSAKRFLEVGLKTLQIIPDDPLTLSRFCVIYTLFGDREKAYDALGRILDLNPKDGLVLYNCAATYALLGDENKACECLGKTLSSGYKNVREWIEGDPDFDGIRESETFRKLLTEFDLQYGG